MHTRKEIITNQSQFQTEITDWLKNDFKTLKKELISIDSTEQFINEEKEELLKKLKKIKLANEIEKFFISHKNIYPKYYAWWDNDNKEVIKHKYTDQ